MAPGAQCVSLWLVLRPRKSKVPFQIWQVVPIGSMYGIFTYIWLIFVVNVGEYTIHGSYGVYSRPMFLISGISSKIGYLLLYNKTCDGTYAFQIPFVNRCLGPPPFHSCWRFRPFFKHLQDPRFDRHNFGTFWSYCVLFYIIHSLDWTLEWQAPYGSTSVLHVSFQNSFVLYRLHPKKLTWNPKLMVSRCVSFSQRGLFQIPAVSFGRYIHTHSIHVWYIYLHLPQKSTKCRDQYTSPMDPMGYISKIK